MKLKPGDLPKMTLADPRTAEEADYTDAVTRWFAGKGPKPAPPDNPLRPFLLAFHGVPLTPVSLRLDSWMIALAKEVARQHDMKYQRVLRLWIMQGLRRAIEDGGKK